MGKQKQAPQPVKKPEQLGAVPVKKETQQMLKKLRNLDTQLSEAYTNFRDAEKIIENYFYWEKGKSAFILGWIIYSSEQGFISALPNGLVAKKDLAESDVKIINSALGKASKALKTLMDATLDANKLLKEINQKEAVEIKAKEEYINLVARLYSSKAVTHYLSNGLEAAKLEYEFETKIKPKQPVISEQKGKVIPIEQAPMIELFPTTEDLLTYGPGPVYYDPYTGAYGSKETVEIAKDIKSGKKKFHIDPDGFLIFVPVIGPAICIVNDVSMIETGTPEEKKMGKIMLAVDIAFMGVDVHWLVHVGVRSATQIVAKDALVKMAKQKAAGTLVTQTEKNVFKQAVYDLSEKEMKGLLKIAQKRGGWGVVTEEILQLAKDTKSGVLSKAVFKDYIKSQSGVKKWFKGSLAGIYKDFGGAFSKKGFQKYMGDFIAREMVHGVNFKALKALGKTIQKLPKKEQKIALNAVFQSMMTFSPKAQKELLKHVQKHGWGKLFLKIEDVIRDIYGSKALKQFRAGKLEEKKLNEAIKIAMQDMFPKYAFAYAISPFREWIRLGVFVGAAHTVYKTVRLLGEYLMAKTENKLKELQKEIEKIEKSEEAMEELPEYTEEELEMMLYTVDFESASQFFADTALSEGGK